MSMPFSDEDLVEAIGNHLPTVAEYVKGHGGDIQLLGVKDGQAYIQLTGACHGCSMSIMTTKMVVERKLKELIHPNLEVVNVEAGQEKSLPGDIVRPDHGADESRGLMKKIRDIL